jgi:hypothetical protein
MSDSLKRFPVRSMVSGALFTIGWTIFIDNVIAASRSPIQEAHPTFVAWVPGILATVAAILVNFTRAADFSVASAYDTHTQAITLVIGWALAFAASCMSLLLLLVRYGGDRHREKAALGVGIVLQTCAIALSAVCSWARTTVDGASVGAVPRL